jgi:hypothetical protein
MLQQPSPDTHCFPCHDEKVRPQATVRGAVTGYGVQPQAADIRPTQGGPPVAGWATPHSNKTGRVDSLEYTKIGKRNNMIRGHYCK